MSEKYNWAILGCGSIANETAQAMQNLGRSFYSVACRTKSKAEDFAKKYNIGKVYDNIDEMFRDENVDIIYIATPHNTHIEYLLKALNAKKHVLCEKSITLNSQELVRAVESAERNNVVLAEAMTVYHMPIYKKIRELSDNGALGELKLVQVSLGSYKPYDMTNRFFNMELAGGAMLDIGVYALAFARMFMKNFDGDITSQVKFAPSGADEQVGILIKNNAGQTATVTLSLHAKLPKLGIASFENGYVQLTDYNRTGKAEIFYVQNGSTEIITAGDGAKALEYEIIDMEKAVDGENNMLLNYTVDVMKVMTYLRNEWGMKYPEE
ncbi:MAG: Gfo/Idh/MocA family protein [Eubacterium sp.]